MLRSALVAAWTAAALLLAPPLGAQDPDRGAQLAARILRTYPFAEPDIRGGATSNPVAVLYVPTPFWNRLSKAEQRDLVAYMPRLASEMQSRPGAYIGIPRSAPLYLRAVRNAHQTMNSGT